MIGIAIFQSKTARANFLEQVGKANPVVKLSIRLALILRSVFGPAARFVPIVKVATKPLDSLVAMHHESPRSLKKAPEFPECIIPEEGHEAFDLVVAGSGPGGGITALSGSEAGERVLIIEQGPTVDWAVPHHSPEQMLRYFEGGGQEVILGNGIVPFAQGRVWGGGSEINSGLYHSLPEPVAQKWCETINGLTPESLAQADRAIRNNLKISMQSAESLGPYTNSPIMAMKEVLSWDGGIVPRWRTYDGEKFSHHGIAETYGTAALKLGARKLVGHQVNKIAESPEEVRVLAKGANCTHEFRAKAICLAAGVVSTPRILSSSGLIGLQNTSFNFHAMVRELAQFNRTVNDLSDIDPHQIWDPNLSVKIGAAVGTPALLRSTIASKTASWRDYANLEKIGAYYASTPASGRGRLVKVGDTLVPLFWQDKDMKSEINRSQATLRGAIREVGGHLIGKPQQSVSTVHVFGSLPIGVAESPVDRTGFLNTAHGRVFVRDSSLLPSAPLVNPQGPLMQLVTVLENERLNLSNSVAIK